MDSPVECIVTIPQEDTIRPCVTALPANIRLHSVDHAFAAQCPSRIVSLPLLIAKGLFIRDSAVNAAATFRLEEFGSLELLTERTRSTVVKPLFEQLRGGVSSCFPFEQ